MKLSARSRYATRILVILAEHTGTVVNTTSLSEQTGISVQFIEQIIRPLKQGGLVTSTRGVTGGHTLASPPSVISLGDVVRAIEGPIDLTQCCDGEAAALCPRKQECPSRPAWLQVSTILENALDNISIADLLTPPPHLAAFA
jgi:Rrf2 family protein